MRAAWATTTTTNSGFLWIQPQNPSGPCITQAVQGNRQLSQTRGFILSADGTFVSHDGWHVIAPAGTPVTTLAALQGEVLGVHNQGDGTYAVDVLVNGGVAIYKD